MSTLKEAARSVAKACRARRVRRSAGAAAKRGEISPALREALAAMESRLAAAPDPLAYLTPELWEAARREGIGDTLGVGPRLAPR